MPKGLRRVGLIVAGSSVLTVLGAVLAHAGNSL